MMQSEDRSEGKSRRGFASMSPEKRREIARRGGKAAHEKGRAHEFTPDEARAAGRKGGLAVSLSREHMARIGRAGGQARRRRLDVSTGEISTEDASRRDDERFGEPAVRRALAHVTFPITRSELLQRTGEIHVELRPEESISLRSIFERPGKEHFASAEEAVDELLSATDGTSRAA